MRNELLLSSTVAAGWLALCFLAFGALYSLSAMALGPETFFAFERSLGSIDVGHGISIERMSLIVCGVSMVVACIPVNYYWLRRETRAREDGTSGGA